MIGSGICEVGRGRLRPGWRMPLSARGDERTKATSRLEKFGNGKIKPRKTCRSRTRKKNLRRTLYVNRDVKDKKHETSALTDAEVQRVQEAHPREGRVHQDPKAQVAEHGGKRHGQQTLPGEGRARNLGDLRLGGHRLLSRLLRRFQLRGRAGYRRRQGRVRGQGGGRRAAAAVVAGHEGLVQTGAGGVAQEAGPLRAKGLFARER